MKKGFTQTLMMTAILVMAAQAMAMAPIIGEIPSPVVGDQDTATPVNTFVYPDAIDLTQYVTDDQTTATLIKWSYEWVPTTGSPNQIYKINGDPALVSGDDPIDPPAQKIIAGPNAVDNDTGNTTTQDSNPNTITIRNIALSPIGGPNTALAAGSHMPQDVTLFASDGDTVTATIVTFFTATGYDHLSGVTPGINVTNRTPGSGTGNSTGFDFKTVSGNITHSVTGNGICMTVPTTVGAGDVDSQAYWESTFGDVPLVQNAAYRIRLIMNGTQTASDTVPLWDVLITNYSGTTGQGLDLYGAEFWMFDNGGSLNGSAQLTKGDTPYDFWWTPPPVLTDRWNSTSTTIIGGTTGPGPYAPANLANNSAFILFRVIDSKHSRTDLHATEGVGSLCLKQFMVDRYDIGNLQADTTPVWQKTDGWAIATDASNVAASNLDCMHYEANTNVTATAATDGITLKATSGNGTTGTGSSANCYAQIAPGDNYSLADPNIMTDTVNIADNYPCPFDPLTLYKVTYMLSAPTQADENSPVDALFVGADTINSEEIQEGYTDTHNWHRGLPAFKVTQNGVTQADGTPQPFVLFFYTNYGQASTNPSFWGWRPKLSITNNNAYISPASGEAKTGGVKLSGITVEKIIGGLQ